MAEKVFMNGNIITMNPQLPAVQAVAVDGGEIVFAGSNADAKKYMTRGCEVIDLKGQMMLPGFIDAHAHPVLASFLLSGIRLTVEMSREEILQEIKSYIEEHKDQRTYFGFGYAEWIFDEKGPRKEDLERICNDKPVFIIGSSGHDGWCNSIALKSAGIDENTPDPTPGLQYYERDENGCPTGHIVEAGPITEISGKIGFFQIDSIGASLEDVFGRYSQMGITTIADVGSFGYMESIGYPLISVMEKSNRLKQRIFGCFFIESRDKCGNAIKKLQELKLKNNSDLFRINTLKIILDGTIETRNASLSEPYNEDLSMVEPMLSQKELNELCFEAASGLFNIHIHAIGDKAVHRTVMAAKVLREAGYSDIRITNAHTEYVAEEDVALFGRYDIIANTTGVWHYGNPLINKIIGDRADRVFMMRSLIDHGARLSLGSDFPVDEYGPEPLKGIQMAVTRRLYYDPCGLVLKPENEKLSIGQCLEGYTINAAYQLGMEKKTGSIEEGKYADFVVLKDNIFETDPSEIYKIPIVMTIMNGDITYKNELY